MVSRQPIRLSKSSLRTLTYFDQFNYPLTLKELYFWQTGSDHFALKGDNRYYYLPGRGNLVFLRKEREQISHQKIRKANAAVSLLRHLPFIKAILITGALSMFNSPESDDIDIMVITDKYCLWILRPLLILYLRIFKLRRDPYLLEHSSPQVSDKICDNLWLDTDHLLLVNRNLYTAHELLQAKCVYDSGGVHKKLIRENSWAEKYLPVAYAETLKTLKTSSDVNPTVALKERRWINFPLSIFNLILFTVQYLYMRRFLTSEKIGLGYAFFHPRRTNV